MRVFEEGLGFGGFGKLGLVLHLLWIHTVRRGALLNPEVERNDLLLGTGTVRVCRRREANLARRKAHPHLLFIGEGLALLREYQGLAGINTRLPDLVVLPRLHLHQR